MYVIATSQPFFSILELLMNIDGLIHSQAKYVFMQKTELIASMQMLSAIGTSMGRLHPQIRHKSDGYGASASSTERVLRQPLGEALSRILAQEPSSVHGCEYFSWQ